MNAIMSYYFLSQQYERDHVIFINVENDMMHASINATHLSHESINHLEVKGSTPHFTAVIIALHLFYVLKRAAAHITLKHSSFTQIVISFYD